MLSIVYRSSVSSPTGILIPALSTMDDDLTASHWDDVLPTSSTNLAASNIGLIFNSLSLDDPHRDTKESDSGAEIDDTERATNEEDDSNVEGAQEPQITHAPSYISDYDSPQSPFRSSEAFNQSELDELNAIKQQERDIHKSSLLMELTDGADGSEATEKHDSPLKISASESLFEDKGSPLKIQPLSKSASATLGQPSLNNDLTSPIKKNQLKSSQFRAPRGRRIASKTVVKHLSEDQRDDLDPLTTPTANHDLAAEKNLKQAEESKALFHAVDRPLYDLPKTSEPAHGDGQTVVPSQPDSDKSELVKSNSNDLIITLGDPVKVGDITTAHIVYSIKTQNKNSKSPFFPQSEGPIVVSRRYKDFRWIYHQLQNNHPGKIIPPPPSKQTYIGRFNENFVENRRLSLEKMLHKISKTPALADDADFVLFLTSQNFAAEAKEREQLSGSGASIQASDGDDEGDKTGSIVTGTSAGGFMSSLFSMTVKYPEPDDFFTRKKGYIDDLEHNLKTFHKSLELIATQRIEIASVVEEISNIVEELADLEMLKNTSELLSAFAEVHAKLKENLDRVNLQDQLTLGFTIEEYLRIIGSVKYTFETRSKIYQLYQSFRQDLNKKQESLDRLNSRYKSSVDKIGQVTFEVDKLKQKAAHYEESFNSVSETIKSELNNFEMEKIQDFRNSVEIFIESSIESQKEAIELWETFYERQNLAQV